MPPSSNSLPVTPPSPPSLPEPVERQPAAASERRTPASTSPRTPAPAFIAVLPPKETEPESHPELVGPPPTAAPLSAGYPGNVSGKRHGFPTRDPGGPGTRRRA